MATKKTPARKAKPRKGVAPGRGGAKGKKGQPRFIKTPEQSTAVMGLVSVGTESWVIAEVMKIPLRTLQRHFQEEMQKGTQIVHARVGGGITTGALEGDKTLMIFYAKSQMGWRDSYRVGFEGANGKPVDPPGLFQINITG